MQVKSWLSSMIHSIVFAIRVRPNRKVRRRAASRTRFLHRMLAAAALTPLLVANSNGDGPLFPGLQLSVGNTPFSVTTGDFNGDGVTDLATANYLSDNVSVLLGVGDGTFAAQATYAAGDNPWSVTTGDFNGDGVTDLATANYLRDNVSVLLGVGDGTFAVQTTYTAGGNPEFV